VCVFVCGGGGRENVAKLVCQFQLSGPSRHSYSTVSSLSVVRKKVSFKLIVSVRARVHHVNIISCVYERQEWVCHGVRKGSTGRRVSYSTHLEHRKHPSSQLASFQSVRFGPVWCTWRQVFRSGCISLLRDVGICASSSCPSRVSYLRPLSDM
jgi:hypothetical protein